VAVELREKLAAFFVVADVMTAVEAVCGSLT
jgi:hypothetical protein